MYSSLHYYFKKKLFKVIFLYQKLFIKTTRPLKGFYNILLTPSYNDKTFEYCFKGTYGTEFSNWLSNINNEMIFIDIGANQGLYSVLAGKNSFVKKVYSFEPNDEILPLLTNNLKLNQIYSHKIIPAAISSHTGKLALTTFEGHSGMSTLQTRNDNDKKKITVKNIETINYIELNKLIPSQPLNGIKIDVEGHEEIVINELVKCDFFKQTQWIFCEIDEQWVNPSKIKDVLQNEGFSNFKRIGNHPTHYDVMYFR